MACICTKPKESCYDCTLFRYGDDDYIKNDLKSKEDLKIWFKKYKNIELSLSQIIFIDDFFEGHGYRLIRKKDYPDVLWRIDIEDKNYEVEEYSYKDILNFLHDNILTFDEDEQEHLWEEYTALPKS